jgi:hypothetical protein
MTEFHFDPMLKAIYTVNDEGQYHSYNDIPAIMYLDDSLSVWMKDGKLDRDECRGPTISKENKKIDYYFKDGKPNPSKTPELHYDMAKYINKYYDEKDRLHGISLGNDNTYDLWFHGNKVYSYNCFEDISYYSYLGYNDITECNELVIYNYKLTKQLVYGTNSSWKKSYAPLAILDKSIKISFCNYNETKNEFCKDSTSLNYNYIDKLMNRKIEDILEIIDKKEYILNGDRHNNYLLTNNVLLLIHNIISKYVDLSNIDFNRNTGTLGMYYTNNNVIFGSTTDIRFNGNCTKFYIEINTDGYDSMDLESKFLSIPKNKDYDWLIFYRSNPIEFYCVDSGFIKKCIDLKNDDDPGVPQEFTIDNPISVDPSEIEKFINEEI